MVKKYPLRIAAVLALSAALASWSSARGEAPDMSRYFFSGDGRITLHGERTGKSFSGVYRKGPGDYDEEALCRISRVFGAPCEPSRTELSLRLVEFIDYLEDRLSGGAEITITSGYRKPEYNTMLRDRGNLAAKASLHQYGMAADLKIQGVKAETLWNHVRDLKFGGAGYYGGNAVHVDVGPARSWEQTTSGVGTGISDDNKLIGIITDYDVYRPGMTVTLRFIRMTAFPIRAASEFTLIRRKGPDDIEKHLDFTPSFNIAEEGRCMEFGNIQEMNLIRWELPVDLKPGRYGIQARFCDDAWPDMPRRIETPEFEVTGTR